MKETEAAPPQTWGGAVLILWKSPLDRTPGIAILVIDTRYLMVEETQGSPKEEGEPQVQRLSGILQKILVWAIYGIALVAPFFYLPFTPDPLFAKQVLIAVLTAIALFSWLIRVLVERRVTYAQNAFHIAAGAMFLILLLSSLTGVDRSLSLFAPDASGERFFSFAAFIILSFLVASEFSRKEVLRLIAFSLGAASILSIHTFFRVAPFVSLPEWLRINPVGTLNANAAVLAGFFLLAFMMVTLGPRAPDGGREKRILHLLSWFTLVGSAANLLLIDFKIGWVGLAAISAILVAFHTSRTYTQDDRTQGVSPLTTTISLLALLALSVLFASIASAPLRFIPGLTSEIEVAPSFQSTLGIGIEVLKTKPALGSGPGTFIYSYDRFHSPAVNQTVFWNTGFSHGFSLLTTFISTIGALGIFVFLIAVLAAFFTLWHVMREKPRLDPLKYGLAALTVFGIILWVIYPANFVMNLGIFLALGGLIAITPAPGERPRFFWQEIGRSSFRVESQASAFLASLFAITMVIFTLLSVYFMIQKYVAEVYFSRGVFEFVRNGNFDTALARFERARALDPQNDRYLLNQSQTYLARMQQSIPQILAGVNEAQQIFRANLDAALDSARGATVLNPNDAGNFLGLGTIYEAALPFVESADRFAIAAYTEAGNREPANPVPPTLIGRTYLTIADLLALRVRQQVLQEKEAAPAIAEAITKAKENLARAVNLKSDHAAAQFLLAQAFSREGNIDEAIRIGISALSAAPRDVGVAFFLGFLLYQKGVMVDAEEYFSRAIEINPNYSNARYFLGLIYDRTRRSGEALKQFRRILELNPDQEEVKSIIANIEAGRQALATITPPPEKRREPPVRERSQEIRKRQ